MKRMVLLFLLAGSFLVGAHAGEKDGVKTPPPGFTSLFNGKDLSNWKNADKQPEWKVVDGTILVTPTVVDVGEGAPVVAVDPHAGPSSLPAVASDNFEGAVTAMRYLLDLGHRRIGRLRIP